MKELSEPLFRAFIGRVQKLGYTAVEPESRDQPTELYKGKAYIGFLLPNGAIYYKPGTGVEKDVHRLTDSLVEMKPPYVLYADASYLPYKGVEKYKTFCKFGDSLLAARLDDDGELRFVTWIYDYGHEGVLHTRYFDTDYAAAKQNFAVRCGLVDEKRVFSDKELGLLYDACFYREWNDCIEDDTVKADLKKMTGRLEKMVVDMQPQEPEPEPEQESKNELEV